MRKFIENQLTSLDKRSKEVEERLRILRTEVKDIQISPAIQGKLTELEVQLVSLMQKYTDKHPAVVKIRGQINDLESQFSEFSKQELEYAGLLREVEVNKKLYEMLKEKLEEARISEAQKVNDVSMLNPAGLPDQAMGTTSESGYLIGGLLGLILGITFAFLREGLDTSIGTMEDVENFIKLPVLGVIPSVPTTFKETKNLFIKLKRRLLHEQKSETEEVNTRLIVHHEPGSSVAEACRNIRTNLKIGPSRKTFLITSAGPREGKTTVLINLGLTVAQTGARTLLVSTDLRRPTVDKTFGIDRTPGISEIITGKVALKDAIRSVSDIMLGSMRFRGHHAIPENRKYMDFDQRSYTH